MARKRKLAAVLFSLGCLQSGSVWALGLGEVTLESFLNEPLRAHVDLLNTGGLQEDQIKVRLATTEDFDRMGVDRAYFLTGIKFEIQVGEDGKGRILLRSDDPVLEPYLDFIIETRWPSGRLLREYTVLVDPPAFDTGPSVSADERVSELEAAAAPAKKKAEPEVVASGTRVGLGQQSRLAPGAMPVRDFSAGTAAEPLPGSRYMIHRDQTLWQIAKAAAPAGASVYQTMLDIQRLNPDAFIDGNINRIKAGYIIYLPDAADISSDDVADALAVVRRQNEDWRAGRVSSPSSSASLRVSAATDSPQAQANSEQTQAQSAGEAGELPSPGDSGEPEPDSGLQPTEASDPSADDRAAELAAREARQEADAVRADLDQSRIQTRELKDRLSALSERLENLERSVSLKDQQIAELQAALAKRQAQATPPANRPLPAEQDSGFGAWLYGLLGLVLGALLGLMFWRRRRDSAPDSAPLETSEADDFASVELRDADLELDDAAVPPVETDLSVAEPEPQQPKVPAGAASRGYGERRHDEYASDVDTGDALAEADIYIAYGRYPQAIELLRTASSAEPENLAYRLKLLDLYLQSGQDAQAREELTAIRDSGDPEAIARAEELVEDLGDEGLGGQGLASSARQELAGSPFADEQVEAFDGPTAGNPAGGRRDTVAPAAADDGKRDAGLPGSDQGLDQNLDQNVDKSLDLGSGPGSDLEADLDAEVHLSDFDTAPDFEENVIDDEAFTGLEIEEAVDLTQDDDLQLGEETLDLGADFDSPESESGLGESVADDEDMIFASEGNPMSTQLDLARAYIDMGDDDGAREILDEVLRDGGEEDQAEARTLIDRLG